MDKEQILRIAVETAVKAAAEYIDKQRKKENQYRKTKKLRNTRILLKNYWLFKTHCEKSICRFSQTVDSSKAIEILDIIDRYDDKAFVSSIKQSIVRTNIILAHVDEMLKLYKVYCDMSDKPEDQRRYRALYAFYFERGEQKKYVSLAEIAEREAVDERTAQRDIRDACYKLGSLIFGIDSLDNVS